MGGKRKGDKNTKMEQAANKVAKKNPLARRPTYGSVNRKPKKKWPMAKSPGKKSKGKIIKKEVPGPSKSPKPKYKKPITMKKRVKPSPSKSGGKQVRG